MMKYVTPDCGSSHKRDDVVRQQHLRLRSSSINGAPIVPAIEELPKVEHFLSGVVSNGKRTVGAVSFFIPGITNELTKGNKAMFTDAFIVGGLIGAFGMAERLLDEYQCVEVTCPFCGRAQKTSIGSLLLGQLEDGPSFHDSQCVCTNFVGERNHFISFPTWEQQHAEVWDAWRYVPGSTKIGDFVLEERDWTGVRLPSAIRIKSVNEDSVGCDALNPMRHKRSAMDSAFEFVRRIDRGTFASFMRGDFNVDDEETMTRTAKIPLGDYTMTVKVPQVNMKSRWSVFVLAANSDWVDVLVPRHHENGVWTFFAIEVTYPPAYKSAYMIMKAMPPGCATFDKN